MSVVVARKFSPDVKGAEFRERVDGCGVSTVVIARKREVKPRALGVGSSEADGVVDQVNRP